MMKKYFNLEIIMKSFELRGDMIYELDLLS